MSENQSSAPIAENKMGTMPIGRLLMSMSLPAIFSMLIQALYNVVDSIYVAQIGEHALTAVSLAFPIQNLMIAVSVGTGVGLNSLISRRLGEHREEEASCAAVHGILISLLESLCFVIFGLFFCRMFFSAFTDDATVIQMGVTYTSIVTVLSFGSFIQICLEKTLQATGNMFYPMVFQLVGAITNIILDPILIFGWLGLPAMGVTGAAVATVAGQILAMLFAVYVIIRKEHAVHITFQGFHFSGAIVRDIFEVGFPSMIMQSISSIMSDGKIIDTVVHGLAGGLGSVPTLLQAPAMLIANTIINVFLTSGSGQAAAVMPILVPLSDLIGVTRQTAVLAYKFGDGFCNYILPTSTALMGIISACNIPYDRWMRFMWKMFAIWLVVGTVMLVIAQLINYGPM